jgi:peptidyl-prolyl cis-trans isomerase SurA
MFWHKLYLIIPHLFGRKRSIFFFVLVLGSLFFFTRPPEQSYGQQVLDRIVAVVGDKIILESELEARFQLYSAQFKPNIKTSEEENNLKRELLDQMINDKLIVTQAEKDTLLQVTPKEVDDALEEEIKGLKEQFPSEEAFQEGLKKEGLTERDLRKKYKSQIKEKLLEDKLVSSKLSSVGISNKEVKDFFDFYQDSLPEQPEAVRLSHILLTIKPSDYTLDSLEQKAEKILSEAENGGDFASLAQKYSEDPSKDKGGDLGFFKKGDLLPEFEKKAFSLNPGEIGMAKTNLGYHIIKSEEKKDDLIHVRHILIQIQPSASDSAQVWAKADSICQLLKNGGDFGQLVKDLSADEESKKMGGELGWYPVSQMTPELKEAVKNLTIGEISKPVPSDLGVHILKVLDKKEQRKLTLDQDWDTIKDMAKRKKANDKILEWVEKIKDKTYIDVRL